MFYFNNNNKSLLRKSTKTEMTEGRQRSDDKVMEKQKRNTNICQSICIHIARVNAFLVKNGTIL